MITLYGCGSPNVFKIQLMLAELGLDHRLETVGLYDGSLDASEFRNLNPNGRLPVLVDDGFPVFESGAILIYLAEKTGRFLPADPKDRSRVMQWLMWQMAGVGPMFGQALHFRFIASRFVGSEGTDYGATRYTAEAERLYDVAETRLSQAEWLGGGDYSIADIAAFPWLGRYARTLGIDLAGRPAVSAWITRIQQRPAFLAVDDTAKTLFKADLAAQSAAGQAEIESFFGIRRTAQ